MKFGTIRQRLAAALLGITIMIPIASAVIFTTHIVLVNRYRSTNDRLLLEYRVIGTTDALVTSYNDVVQLQSPERMANYWAKRKTLDDLVISLPPPSYSGSASLLYEGLTNIIRNIEKETDAGVQTFERGGIEDTSLHYDQATQLLPFVHETVASLVLSELEYGVSVQQQIEAIQRFGFITGGIVVLLLTVLGLTISYNLSRELTEPLSRLAKHVSSLSPERLNTHVDADLREHQDEIGVLARAFDEMIGRLRDDIAKIVASNQSTVEAKNQLEKTNIELERFSRLTVDRELMMVKLKDELKKTKVDLDKAKG